MRQIHPRPAVPPILSPDLARQRFLRGEHTPASEAGPEVALAAPYLSLMVNLDLNRRKLVWVGAALSYMLENTEVDVRGRELRTPFPSFAIVYADRHALSLGERLLARRPDDPLRGQILRVVTVYVTERPGGDERLLSIAIAFEALGSPGAYRRIDALRSTRTRTLLTPAGSAIPSRPMSRPPC